MSDLMPAIRWNVTLPFPVPSDSQMTLTPDDYRDDSYDDSVKIEEISPERFAFLRMRGVAL